MSGKMNCKICQSPCSVFGRAKIMGKYMATYRRCDACGFIYVAEPHWLPESYQSTITKTDMGLVFRTDVTSRITQSIIDFFFDRSGRFLDYGAGYGLFVRKMRDIGYDFHAYDPYCDNLFASQFQVQSLADDKFEMVTAFEVFEHIQDPREAFAEILRRSQALLFSTELVPSPAPAPGKWWYYALEHGQHISFFTLDSLARVAASFGGSFYSNGSGIHLITSRRIRPWQFRLATESRVCRFLSYYRRHPSLLPSDSKKARAEVLRDIGYGSEVE